MVRKIFLIALLFTLCSFQTAMGMPCDKPLSPSASTQEASKDPQYRRFMYAFRKSETTLPPALPFSPEVDEESLQQDFAYWWWATNRFHSLMTPKFPELTLFLTQGGSVEEFSQLSEQEKQALLDNLPEAEPSIDLPKTEKRKRSLKKLLSQRSRLAWRSFKAGLTSLAVEQVEAEPEIDSSVVAQDQPAYLQFLKTLDQNPSALPPSQPLVPRTARPEIENNFVFWWHPENKFYSLMAPQFPELALALGQGDTLEDFKNMSDEEKRALLESLNESSETDFKFSRPIPDPSAWDLNPTGAVNLLRANPTFIEELVSQRLETEKEPEPLAKQPDSDQIRGYRDFLRELKNNPKALPIADEYTPSDSEDELKTQFRFWWHPENYFNTRVLEKAPHALDLAEHLIMRRPLFEYRLP